MAIIPGNIYKYNDYDSGREWYNTVQLKSRKFTCANCSSYVASSEGYAKEYLIDYNGEISPGSSLVYGIYLCTHCDFPTYFTEKDVQFPMPSFGKEIADLPDDIDYLYNEARSSFSATAFTGAVLLLSLIHI